MSEPTSKEHITKVGMGPYSQAYAWAMFSIRQDARLVGLDKLRRAIAHKAALYATGFPTEPLILPRRAGKATEEMQRIAEEVLAKAIEVAKQKRVGA